MINLDIGELKNNNNQSLNASRRVKPRAQSTRSSRRRISIGVTSEFGDSDIFLKNSNITPRSQIDFFNNSPGQMKNGKLPHFSDLPEVHKPLNERNR